MSMTRREWLRTAGILVAASVAPVVSACGADDDEQPFVDTLPDYTWDGEMGPETLFESGVASGDPLSDAVVVWTRADAGTGEPVSIWVEVSQNREFTQRVVAEAFSADAATDYTFKLDVDQLDAGTTYYYRFFAQGRMSPVGRTKTLPSGSVDHARIAFVTCANYGFGFFHAYRGLAARSDVDIVVHLGDYIYEYQDGFYPFPNQAVRPIMPADEIITLEQYRERYRHYRGDADLRESHRQFPWFVIWDDHEFANDAYPDGAQNHSQNEGDWPTRLSAGKQAFFEYIPIRGVPADGIRRQVSYGDLFDLILLDNRMEGRSVQINNADDDTDARTMLGAAQEQWFTDTITASTARWRLLGQQSTCARMTDNAETRRVLFWDQWDGYPAAQQRLYSAMENNNNIVAVAGDLHGACAFELTSDPWGSDYDPATGAGAVAVEFVTPSVTSPYLAVGELTNEAERVKEASPHCKFTNFREHGYIVLDVTPERVQADFFVVADITVTEGNTETFMAGFTVADDSTLVQAADSAAPSGEGDELA